jgi:alpha-L-fucosidase
MKSVILPVVLLVTIGAAESQVESPSLFGPAPSPSQIAWQKLEYSAFLHFSMNTFTDKEWGYGDEPESLFMPSAFDAESIVRTVKDARMKSVILTCKHHDGFCLWPTATTEHSVKKSPWKNGRGDVVKEISDACRVLGLGFGVYLSPWDRNSGEYGRPEYLNIYRKQLTELLSNYGPVSEVWFDGANGGDGYYGGARETRIIDRKTYYKWNEMWGLVKKLQPRTVIFSDGGPDVRWVGDEEGYAGEMNWSLLRRDEVFPGYEKYTELISGHADGTHWVPAECDVSIRPGWFYHPKEDTLVKSPLSLYNLYFQSVGRNASLLLNVPPDRRGRIHPQDSSSLMSFKQMRDLTFKVDHARKGRAAASHARGNNPRFSAASVNDGNPETYWSTDDGVTTASVTLELDAQATVGCVLLQEYTPLGQRVEKFSIDVWTGSDWAAVDSGTTIGYKRLLRFSPLPVSKIRLTIMQSRACPAISTIGLFQEGFAFTVNAKK